MTLEHYANELIALAQSGSLVADAVKRTDELYHAYMVDVAGETEAKKKALLDAFRNQMVETPLTWPIINKIAGLEADNS